jgi:ABC-type antimicrobial peptide transport system permease subunit
VGVKRTVLAAVLAIVVGLPAGWLGAMLLTPTLWRLEPILHMELAGHSGPADWVFYVVWVVVIPALFAGFRWLARAVR